MYLFLTLSLTLLILVPLMLTLNIFQIFHDVKFQENNFLEQTIVKGNLKSVPYFLTDPSFQEVNIPFVLPFKNQNDSNTQNGLCLPKSEIADYNVLVVGTTVFKHRKNI